MTLDKGRKRAEQRTVENLFGIYLQFICLCTQFQATVKNLIESCLNTCTTVDDIIPQ